MVGGRTLEIKAASMELRVGIYNIAGGKNTRDLLVDRARLQRLLAKIRELRCDVLGLVEVRSNPHGLEPNAAAEIANELQTAGYYSCFGAALSENAFPERVEK